MTDPVKEMVPSPCSSTDLDEGNNALHVVNSHADRHQGWYTEYQLEPQINQNKTKRATDYVVQTTYLREPQAKVKNKSAERRRVHLILRFRSMLNRRGHVLSTATEPRFRRAYSLKSTDSSDAKCIPISTSTVKHSAIKSTPIVTESTTDQKKTHIKRWSSDTCLKTADCQLHIRAVEAQLPAEQCSSSPSALSPISDRTSDTSVPELFRDTLTRIQSLSTGNICCMFALRCIPSVEYLASPQQYHSPHVRRQSLPAPSIKSPTDKEPSSISGHGRFAMDLLKTHLCYQDVNQNLNQWVKQTLTNYSGITEAQPDWCKHVRFADEATWSSSATTLNSLSASSSTRSLTSLAHAGLSYSPHGSMTQLPMQTNQQAQPCQLTHPNHITSALPVRSKSLGSQRSKKFFQKLVTNKTASESTSNEFTSLKVKPNEKPKPLSLYQRLWNRKRKKGTKTTKMIPLVTVNIIQDCSEPPEIPSHVLRQLNIRENEPHWKKTFADPAECANFIERLVRQRVCLGRLRIRSACVFDLEVHVLSTNPFATELSNVCLRYTLNNWDSYTESSPLQRSHFEKKQLSICQTQWTEVYTGNVEFAQSDLTPVFNRFEFAVVCRTRDQEHWDNHDQSNYVCLWTTDEY